MPPFLRQGSTPPCAGHHALVKGWSLTGASLPVPEKPTKPSKPVAGAASGKLSGDARGKNGRQRNPAGAASPGLDHGGWSCLSRAAFGPRRQRRGQAAAAYLLLQDTSALLEEGVDHDGGCSGTVLIGVRQPLEHGEQEAHQLVRRDALPNHLSRGQAELSSGGLSLSEESGPFDDAAQRGPCAASPAAGSRTAVPRLGALQEHQPGPQIGGNGGSKGQATAPKEARGHLPRAAGQHGQITWGSLGMGWDSTTKPLWPPPNHWEDAPPGLITVSRPDGGISCSVEKLVGGLFTGVTTFEERQLFQDKKILPASLQLQVLLEQCLQSSQHRKWPSRRSSSMQLSLESPSTHPSPPDPRCCPPHSNHSSLGATSGYKVALNHFTNTAAILGGGQEPSSCSS